MTQVRVALVVVGLLLVAGCSSGGDEQGEAPECPPVSTTEPGGTTTTDPRCVQTGEERHAADADADASEGEVWEGTMNTTLIQVGDVNPDACPGPDEIKGTARFVVNANGKVTGTYDLLTGCNVSQPHAEFTGTATDEGFSIPQVIVQTNGELIPKVSPTRAHATLTNFQDGGTGSGTRYVTEWDMRCVNC